MKKGNYLEVNEAASSITATSKRSYCPQNMGIISLKKNVKMLNTVSAVIKSES
jgi:hypothetical protein